MRGASPPEVLATPGNAGIARDGIECLPSGDVVEAAREREVDLVVVGPEAPLVAGLVDEGLVSRAADPLDRRIAWLTVTPEGRKLLSRRRRNMDSFLVKRLRGLPPEDVATLERASEIIAGLTEEPHL